MNTARTGFQTMLLGMLLIVLGAVAAPCLATEAFRSHHHPAAAPRAISSRPSANV